MDHITDRIADLSPEKRALLAKRLSRRGSAGQGLITEPIAIIGMGCRFPGGANNPTAFWQLLENGVDAITEVPAERWDVEAYYDPTPGTPGKMYTRYGGFLDQVDRFDARFFGISPREAVRMDPQQRLLLEVAWEALEDAGQTRENLAGSPTGVFVGVCISDYARLQLADQQGIDGYSATGSALSIVANRVSYWLDLHGPSVAVDTACSSSLVAVHLACQALHLRECNLALAGGVNLILSPEGHISFCKWGMLAPDGRCKTFDARADGFSRGEGCGVVVLKRLSEALAAGDPIRAVIRGSAVNQDGRTHGLTAPNGLSQQAVIRQALKNAGIEPAQVGYIETHGTGTALGDPIEVEALAAVYGRASDSLCALGSVKTNLGHLEAASGVAGLIKTVLTLQHGQIPPHLHFTTLNPHISLENTGFVIPAERQPWPAHSRRRYAAVSSFGFGGTNVHTILEEAPSVTKGNEQEDAPDAAVYLLPISAHTPEALRDLAQAYRDFVTPEGAGAETPLRDMSYTAGARRSHHDHRLALVFRSRAMLEEQLRAFLAGEVRSGGVTGQRIPGETPGIAFVFSGQGSQWAGMGRRLIEREPVFREALERCEQAMQPYLERSLLERLKSDEPRPGDNQIDVIQPALFAMQVALACLWRSWGIEPDAVVGHSMGEVAAAHVAGALSLEDAVRVICTRSRLLRRVSGQGAMMAVELSVAQAREVLAGYEGRIAVAVSNGPASTVLSGDPTALESLGHLLQERGIYCRRVKVDVASHSSQMDSLLPVLLQELAGLQPQRTSIPLYSTVTGKPVNGEDLDARYWVRNLREPVLFATAVEQLLEDGHSLFVEISPHPILLSAVQQTLYHLQRKGKVLPSLRREEGEQQVLLSSLATLYAQGVSVEWSRLYPEGGRHVPLPMYPWQRERFWIEQVSVRVPEQSPDSTAQWASLVEAGRQQARQGPLDLFLPTFPAKWQALDRLTVALMVDALHKLGMYTRPGERHTVDGLLQNCQVLPLYRHLLSCWLDRLVDEGLLELDGEGYLAQHSLVGPPLDDAWREVRDRCADLPFVIELLTRCGEYLTDVLRGHVSPLDLLFPGGSFALAEGLYQHSPTARYFNQIVRAVVMAAERAWPAQEPLRIIEVGAGTGGTTAALLPVLPAERTRYWFTDLSNLFLMQARHKFAAYPFVQYGLLNIEQDPTGQGYEPHSFSMVVAANVLHATRDLEEALEHVRALLVPGGMLVLWEVTTPQPWFDVSIGLIEGWQRYNDGWRQDGPLLTLEAWEKLLQAQGFKSVVAFPETGSPAEVLGQHILLAQAPIHVTAQEREVGLIADVDPGFRGSDEAVEEEARLTRTGLMAAPPEERRPLMEAYLSHRVAQTMGMAVSVLDRHQSLINLGFDSLMAVRLIHRIEADLGVAVSVASLLQGMSVVELAGELLQQMVEPATEPEEVKIARILEQVEQLSEEEVEALLAQKRARVRGQETDDAL